MTSKISIEELTIAVLENANQPLLISEIVEEIRKIKPDQFKGKTPNKSLYSIIYRNDAKRREKFEKEIFSKMKRGRQIYLGLNDK